MEKNRKRVTTALLIFMVPVIALTGRLFYIQILCHDAFKEAATSQYEMAVEGMDTRGQIYDRNLKPLTGGSYQYYYIIKKERMTPECKNLLSLLDGSQIAAADSDYFVYRTETYSSDINEKLKNGCSLEKYYVSSEEPGILESHIPNRGTSIWEWTKGSTEIVTKNTGMVQAILKETIPKGQITIEKNSADSGEPLKDAVYQVTAKEDIVSLAGVVLMKAGTEAGSVTTGTDGKAVVGNLYAGKYTVR